MKTITLGAIALTLALAGIANAQEAPYVVEGTGWDDLGAYRSAVSQCEHKNVTTIDYNYNGSSVFVRLICDGEALYKMRTIFTGAAFGAPTAVENAKEQCADTTDNKSSSRSVQILRVSNFGSFYTATIACIVN